MAPTQRSRRRRMDKYFVVPRPRQREARAQPDEWVVEKGTSDRSANTVRVFDDKRSATERAKTLAKKNDTVARVFDAAKKSSRSFDYR